MAELLDVAEARRARAVRSPRLAHPFMDRDPGVQRECETLIHSFLLGGGSSARSTEGGFRRAQ